MTSGFITLSKTNHALKIPVLQKSTAGKMMASVLGGGCKSIVFIFKWATPSMKSTMTNCRGSYESLSIRNAKENIWKEFIKTIFQDVMPCFQWRLYVTVKTSSAPSIILIWLSSILHHDKTLNQYGSNYNCISAVNSFLNNMMEASSPMGSSNTDRSVWTARCIMFRNQPPLITFH